MKKIRMMMAAALGVLVSCGSVKSGEEVVAASRDSKVVVAPEGVPITSPSN